MISKSTVLVAVVAMATNGASAQPYAQSADANTPSTSGSTGPLPPGYGPHPGYYKFRGTQPPTGYKTFPYGDPFETCKEWMQNDLHLNSDNMKGNYQLQDAGSFLCMAYNTDKGDVVFVSEGTAPTWYTIKGNNVGASEVMSLAQASAPAAPAAPAARKSRKSRKMQSASEAQVAEAASIPAGEVPGWIPSCIECPYCDPCCVECHY